MLDRGIIKKVLFFFKKVLNFCFPPKIFHMPVFFVIFFFLCVCVCVFISIWFNNVFGGCNLNAKRKKKKKEQEKSMKAAVQHSSISS